MSDCLRPQGTAAPQASLSIHRVFTGILVHTSYLMLHQEKILGTVGTLEEIFIIKK